MGNNKFKLSDMIPNAWFYKLRDMGKNNRYRKKKTQATSSSSSSLSNSSSLFSSTLSTNSNSTSIQPKTKQSQITHHRQSYYYSRELSPPHSKSSILETKLPNSQTKSPKQIIRSRGGNRASFEKQNSPTFITSDSANRFSITNFKSFDSNFDVCGPISDIKSSNSQNRSQKLKTRNRGNIPASNTNLNIVEKEFVGLDTISETKLPNPSGTIRQQRIKSRLFCDNTNPNISTPSSSENSDSNTNFQFLEANACGFYPISKTDLPPIITKKKIEAKNEKKISAPKKHRNTPVLKHSPNSTGVRLRSYSPRIGKINESGRKSFSSGRRKKLPESFAVVKSSSDPQKDFRESMMEMILQNDILHSNELEELLACYLQLNCDEYHEMIIKVFKQIWFDLANVRV